MKNIVICCDGTGNEISENISNVLKLYRCLRKTGKTEPHQVVFYDPGVGTLERPDPWKKLRQDATAIFGLVTGYGLDNNVLAAYRFLVHNYEEGDDIYLFGFSRGAYTVRVLAGLIHKVGLVTPAQSNLAGSGLTAYKQVSASFEKQDRQLGPSRFVGGADSEQDEPLARDDQAAQFARILSVRWPTVKFVGVWDTVASVIVPRPDRLYLPSLEQLAYTQENPSVKIFRQAMSIDERRRMFRLQPWDQPQTFMQNRFSKTNNEAPQDSLQVWFAGVHSDIGGGYPEKESAIAKYPLLWMIEEAVKCGLAVNPRTVNQLAWGVQRKGSPFSYVAPDFAGELHNSMTWGWRPLEYLPKADKYKEWKVRRSFLEHYIPDAEPRPIPEGAFIHQSVVDRIQGVGGYQPVNMPLHYQVVPMSSDPRTSSQPPGTSLSDTEGTAA
jgi:uncharacterized protein (DUF2235 family)